MNQFFRDFLRKNSIKILFFSFWRLVSFGQVLFWPYAFSKVINIITETPGNFKEAVFWACLILINAVSENFIRLQSKLGMEKLGSRLKISLATFFCQKTEIRDGKKTGEAVQTIKKASEDIESIVNYYKDNLLQLPINFVVIPLVLFRASIDYLLLLLTYMTIYLAIDFFAVGLFNQRMKKFYKKAEVFWGTTYRKTPEIWRQREDGHRFIQEIDQEGEDLYQADVSAMKVNTWRWIFLQCFSGASIGITILFVLYRIIHHDAHVGDLILVASYFQETQGTLNIITSSLTRIIQTRLSLKRLNESVKIK